MFLIFNVELLTRFVLSFLSSKMQSLFTQNLVGLAFCLLWQLCLRIIFCNNRDCLCSIVCNDFHCLCNSFCKGFSCLCNISRCLFSLTFNSANPWLCSWDSRMVFNDLNFRLSQIDSIVYILNTKRRITLQISFFFNLYSFASLSATKFFQLINVF